jgi:hypothetical protein
MSARSREMKLCHGLEITLFTCCMLYKRQVLKRVFLILIAELLAEITNTKSLYHSSSVCASQHLVCRKSWFLAFVVGRLANAVPCSRRLQTRWKSDTCRRGAWLRLRSWLCDSQCVRLRKRNMWGW